MKTRKYTVTFHREDKPGQTFKRVVLATSEEHVVSILGNDDSFDDCITIAIKDKAKADAQDRKAWELALIRACEGRRAVSTGA